ncbi:hypothetical protein EST38_g7511 [Candolleomyces aberdarensis]|uniref:Lariat debranching enzyme C-terminal domain-containing protein n=1 Tax=Candolleomyces aberdarensis TaxID=2316362 RepID=A0A4Q2DIA8_9AGAR|nr:hypothetical protein EST38_g7511 [Candolleomyces aberdarensis]
MDLLQSLKPQRWFSAHLHTRFEATYAHLDEQVEVEAPMPATTTQFLGLDQCLPERKYLEVIDIDVPSPNPTPVISFDPEWLAINRALHQWFSTTQYQPPLPDEQEARAMVAKELEWVNANIEKDEHGFIPVEDWQTFVKTAPTLGSDGDVKEEQPPAYTNPQTVSFCKMLDIEDKINS